MLNINLKTENRWRYIAKVMAIVVFIVFLTIFCCYQTANAETTADYTIRHYVEQMNGSYAVTEVVEQAEPGTVVSPAVWRTELGSYQSDYRIPAAQSAIVKADGSTEINYYYVRKHYVLKLYEDGENEAYARLLKAYCGVPTTLPTLSDPEGLKEFTGWSTTPVNRTVYAGGTSVTDLGADGEIVALYAMWMTPEYNVAAASQGQVIITMGPYEEAVFPNLPAGTTYEVEEINIPSGWSLDDRHLSGTEITPNGTSVATFTNSYQTEANVYVTAYKRLINGTLEDGMFKFEVAANNQPGGGSKSGGSFRASYANTAYAGAEDKDRYILDINGEEIENPNYGLGLIGFNVITITEPGIYRYVIWEIIPDDAVEENGIMHDDNYVYDTHIEEFTVVATDNGDGTMSTEIVWDDDGPVFTNEAYLNMDGVLSIDKEIRNATPVSETQEFKVKVIIKDEDGNELTGGFDYTTGDKSGSYVSGTIIEMRGGNNLTISNLPVGAIYEIYEESEEGWEKLPMTNGSGIIRDKDEGINEALVPDVYSAIGEIQLTAKKEVAGGTVGRNEFRFELRDASNTLLGTVYAAEDGSIAFSPLNYTEADHGNSYTYYISEIAEESEIMDYDTSVKTVVVDIADNGNGTMTVEATYPVADANTGERKALFTNVMRANLHVSIETRGNLADLFERFHITVTLTNEDGTPYNGKIDVPGGVTGWENTSDGVYEFNLGPQDEFSISLPHGVRYNVVQNPKDYYTTKTSESGQIDATVGDSYVEFVNWMQSVVPTGLGDYWTIGAWLLALSVIALGAALIVKRKGRKSSGT